MVKSVALPTGGWPIESLMAAGCRVQHFTLASGKYVMKLALIETRQTLESIDEALPFDVVDGEVISSHSTPPGPRRCHEPRPVGLLRTHRSDACCVRGRG